MRNVPQLMNFVLRTNRPNADSHDGARGLDCTRYRRNGAVNEGWRQLLCIGGDSSSMHSLQEGAYGLDLVGGVGVADRWIRRPDAVRAHEHGGETK